MMQIYFLYYLLFSSTGQVGYVTLGMYDTKEALIGDTFINPGSDVIPLPGFKASKPVVLILYNTILSSE